MNIHRLFFQCTILITSYVFVYCAPPVLPPRLLIDHKYELVGEGSWVQELNFRIDEICFMKNMVWYSLFSHTTRNTSPRKYFLAWEVKFLQMTSARVIFSISGLRGVPNWLVSCQFKYPGETQDFHREIYSDRVPEYTINPRERQDRVAIWQQMIKNWNTDSVTWPDSLTKYCDIKALTKIKSFGDEAGQLQIMATSNDDVKIYYENHKEAGNEAKIFTIISENWIEAEEQTVPLALVIFGKDNYQLVNCNIENRLVVKVISDYYVISLATEEQVSEVYTYLIQNAEALIPLPPIVEQHIGLLE